MKETYSVKPPKHIEIGDPWYFKMFKGDELDRLTVRKYIEPFYDACRITLEETPCEEMPELMLLDMTIYIAPKERIDTYLGGMMYKGQLIDEKDIGVDTARYDVRINGKNNTIYTGADGAWGSYTEYYLEHKGMRGVDCMIINLGFSSDFDTMESMREHLRYFFDDVQQIENAPEPEIDESEDIANEPKI